MVEAERVGEELAELMGRLGVHFARVEPFVQAGKYVRGLLSDLPRKNCWTLAEYAGGRHPGPDAAAAGPRVVGHPGRDGHSSPTHMIKSRSTAALLQGAMRD